MSISTVTFDLDGVYFPNGKANFIASLAKLGVSQEEAVRVFLKSPQMNLDYKNGQLTDDQFWSWAVSEWKLTIPWSELVQTMIDGYDVDLRVVDTVKKLRNRGYKTAICSNNFPARVNGLHQRYKFLDNFDLAVFSYQVGASKPNLAIFNELVKRSQSQASSIVFADDNPDNLAGAQEVGITTFLYQGFDRYLDQLLSVGVKI